MLTICMIIFHDFLSFRTVNLKLINENTMIIANNVNAIEEPYPSFDAAPKAIS